MQNSSPRLTPSPASVSAQPQTGRAWHWVYLAALISTVLLLHLLAGHWIRGQQRLVGQTVAAKPPVEVILLQPQVIRQTNAQTASIKSAARPKTRESRPAAAATSTEAPALQAMNTDPAPASAPAASAVAASAGTASDSAAVATHSSRTPEPSDGEQFSLPPAADLRYDTFINGMQNMPGTISWISDGQSYDLIVSVPVPFAGKYTYQSHGHVDAFGLAPERYSEQRGTRARDETEFDRSAKRIGFSRTATSVALPNGAQDRFSMVFQLASLVRGNPVRYTPGVTRSFYVVDSDSGENWPVETVGVESVRIGETYVETLHFMRLPRHAGDKRKIDVWLAPALGYFPARIMQTEPNGTQIELLLHDAPQRLEALSESAGSSAAAPKRQALPAESGSLAPSAIPNHEHP